MTHLVVALRTPSIFQAQVAVATLGRDVEWYKLGSGLVLRRGFRDLIDALKDGGKRVMLDLKSWDIPGEMADLCGAALEAGVDAMTVRCEPEFLSAARGAGVNAYGSVTVLGVGRLTSQGYVGAMSDAALCKAWGCGMVVHPGALDPSVRPGLRMAATGVRMAGEGVDEHVHAVTPFVAARMGAEWVIVGRPIVRAASPHRAAMAILHDLAKGEELGP